jgi:hypothetical protein
VLTELTEYAFSPDGPVRRVFGQHRPVQAQIAREFAAFIENNADSTETTVALAEQRGGLGKTVAYSVVLLLHIALTGQRAGYSTFTRALRNSIKDSEPQLNRVIRETLINHEIAYQPIRIVEYQSPTAFISPTKCKAIATRLAERRIPTEDVPEVQEFLDCFAASERPCEFADLYTLMPTLPCGWTELALALCPADRDEDDWKIVQQYREDAHEERTLVLLTHAMVVRNNLRHGHLFRNGEDEEDPFDIKTMLIDEADKMPSVANTVLRVTVSRNEIQHLLEDVQDSLDRRLRAEGEHILSVGLDQLGAALSRVNFTFGRDDPPAIQISQALTGINHGLQELARLAFDTDVLTGDRIRLCRDAVRMLAKLRDFEHPVLRVTVVRDPAGEPDVLLTLEIGGGRRLISQMWRRDGGHGFQTITLCSALMTNMPPYGHRYDRFRRDLDLDRTKGDRFIERQPLHPRFGNIASVFVADRVPALLPTDASEINLLRQSSLDGLAKQIATAARLRNANERVVVLFQSYVAMNEVIRRLPDEIRDRVVTRNRRHLSDAVGEFIERRYGIWMGVDWEGINFVHPRTRRTMVNALIITRMPLPPRDEIRAMRLGNTFGDNSRASGVALYEGVHAAYRKLYHGVLMGIRSERDVLDELWILDPRWPLPAYVYQQQPPQIIRSIAGSLFHHFERVVESYRISNWYKVSAEGEATAIISGREAA